MAILAILPISATSWGFYAHKTINYSAVFTLPRELFRFYKPNIDYIREHAVRADQRRYVNPNEAPKHYIDVDAYESAVPLDTLPMMWNDAVNTFSRDTLLKHGIAPWNIQWMTYQLTEAFYHKDYPNILRLSADLGHYIGDIHVPLHTTKNYNGQLTDQHGIHGLWESRLPEIYLPDYDLFTGKARYIDNVAGAIWQRIEESYAAKDSVLHLELEASQQVESSNKYSIEPRGQQLTKTYSAKFCRYYNKKLDDMVERRLRSAIELTGSIWYTAWVDAGQPHLEPDSTYAATPILIQKDSLEIIGRPEPGH
jgi:hypothetical protein